jgi:hypothetical protein
VKSGAGPCRDSPRVCIVTAAGGAGSEDTQVRSFDTPSWYELSPLSVAS